MSEVNVFAAFVHSCWLKRCSPVVSQVLMSKKDVASDTSKELVSVDSDLCDIGVDKFAWIVSP